MNTKPQKSKAEPRECECGCGEKTSGTRFRQGHDARLKSALIKAALTGSKRAAQKLESLGWTKFLEAKRAGLPDIPRSKNPRHASKQKAFGTGADLPAVEPYRVVLPVTDGTGFPSSLSDTGEG